MKLVVQVTLLPSPEQAAALEATLRACNSAADRASAAAFEAGVFSRNDLQELIYAELKADFGLSAQPAVRTVKKVVDAYATLRANIRAGNLGPTGSRRRVRAESKPIVFRPDAVQPFDDRCLSWQYDAGTVSIWTVAGRLRGIPYTGHRDHLAMLAGCRRGESDLVHREGRWFLLATCEVEAEPLNRDPVDWIGVDRGVVNLATTSDGDNHTGHRLDRHLRWQARERKELQARRTRSANRRLKRRAKKEARHTTHVNHKIAKKIVADAWGHLPCRRPWGSTGRGVALEDLGGIRERGRLHAHQRARLSSWPFHQLGEHLAYKPERAGVPFLEVDSAYTSQRCPRCGHTARNNRPCGAAGAAGPQGSVVDGAAEGRQSGAGRQALVPDGLVDVAHHADDPVRCRTRPGRDRGGHQRRPPRHLAARHPRQPVR